MDPTGVEIKLLDMFSLYQPPQQLSGALSQAVVEAASIDPASRRIQLRIFTKEYITEKDWFAVSRDICRQYDLANLAVEATYPAEQLESVQPDELMELFVGVNTMTRGILSGSQWISNCTPSSLCALFSTRSII